MREVILFSALRFSVKSAIRLSNTTLPLHPPMVLAGLIFRADEASPKGDEMVAPVCKSAKQPKEIVREWV